MLVLRANDFIPPVRNVHRLNHAQHITSIRVPLKTNKKLNGLLSIVRNGFDDTLMVQLHLDTISPECFT
jgi:hypothetical protein